MLLRYRRARQPAIPFVLLAGLTAAVIIGRLIGWWLARRDDRSIAGRPNSYIGAYARYGMIPESPRAQHHP
jgi:hypothetical protein